jgi:ribosomal protein S18 acetylase RimI-like enzyme
MTNERADSPGIVVRAPGVADAARLAAINIEAWRAAYEGIVPPGYLADLDLSAYEDRWVARIEAPGDRIHRVADLDGVPAAYATGGSYRTQQDAEPGEDTTGWAEIYAIYADPQAQGRGAGTAVHDAVLGALHTRGHRLAALWVLRDNLAALRWYDARGWRPDGASSEWRGAGVPLTEVRLVRPTNGSFQPRSSRLGR